MQETLGSFEICVSSKYRCTELKRFNENPQLSVTLHAVAGAETSTVSYTVNVTVTLTEPRP